LFIEFQNILRAQVTERDQQIWHHRRQLKVFFERMQSQILEKDMDEGNLLVSLVFVVWKSILQETKTVDAQEQLERSCQWVMQLQEDRNSLQGQLEQVLATMQRELRTKEELAAELRESYAHRAKRHVGLPTPPGRSFSPHPRTPGSLQAAPTQPPKCSNCGNIYMADAVFCRHCGQKRQEVLATEPMAETSAGGAAVAVRASTPSRVQLLSRLEGIARGATVTQDGDETLLPEESHLSSPERGTGSPQRRPSALPSLSLGWDAAVSRMEGKGLLHTSEQLEGRPSSRASSPHRGSPHQASRLSSLSRDPISSSIGWDAAVSRMEDEGMLHTSELAKCS